MDLYGKAGIEIVAFGARVPLPRFPISQFPPAAGVESEKTKTGVRLCGECPDVTSSRASNSGEVSHRKRASVVRDGLAVKLVLWKIMIAVKLVL